MIKLLSLEPNFCQKLRLHWLPRLSLMEAIPNLNTQQCSDLWQAEWPIDLPSCNAAHPPLPRNYKWAFVQSQISDSIIIIYVTMCQVTVSMEIKNSKWVSIFFLPFNNSKRMGAYSVLWLLMPRTSVSTVLIKYYLYWISFRQKYLHWQQHEKKMFWKKIVV